MKAIRSNLSRSTPGASTRCYCNLCSTHRTLAPAPAGSYQRDSIVPISDAFANRLLPQVVEIAHEFGTPFHIYDEAGIVEGGHRLNELFAPLGGFREFFAVKALPNLRILDIL